MAGTQAGTQELEGKVFDFRVTKGVARYTGNFTPTTQSLPTALATLRTRGYVGAAPLAADTLRLHLRHHLRVDVGGGRVAAQ